MRIAVEETYEKVVHGRVVGGCDWKIQDSTVFRS